MKKRYYQLIALVFVPLICLSGTLAALALSSRSAAPAVFRDYKQTDLRIRNDWRCIRDGTQHKVVGIVENMSAEPEPGVKIVVDLYKADGIYWRSRSQWLDDFDAYDRKAIYIDQFVPPGIQIGQCEVKLANDKNQLLVSQ